MLILLFILVLVLHIWAIVWLLRPDESPITPAQPLMMEVSMLAVTASRPSVAPPAAAPAQQEKKPEPKKPEPQKPIPKKPAPKPTPHKTPPVEQKPLDLGPAEKKVEQSVSQPAAESSSAANSKAEAAAAATQFTEASFRASYLHNPKPEYPSVAKSRGWEGKVLLKVKVSATGASETVEIEHGSGHETLDESAIEAVRQWRFVPAKHGETAVSSTVTVPIVFHLSED
ncbi:MAG: energy transducer TonB [Methylococcales bacterium]|nr:energy transducer TonB [Methylococcales bacterium]